MDVTVYKEHVSFHNLDCPSANVICQEAPRELVQSARLFGVQLHERLTCQNAGIVLWNASSVAEAEALSYLPLT